MARRLTEAELLAIAATAVRVGDAYRVRSSNGQRTYLVTASGCTCPDFEHRGGFCRHRQAVELLCPTPATNAGEVAPLDPTEAIKGDSGQKTADGAKRPVTPLACAQDPFAGF